MELTIEQSKKVMLQIERLFSDLAEYHNATVEANALSGAPCAQAVDNVTIAYQSMYVVRTSFISALRNWSEIEIEDSDSSQKGAGLHQDEIVDLLSQENKT